MKKLLITVLLGALTASIQAAPIVSPTASLTYKVKFVGSINAASCILEGFTSLDSTMTRDLHDHIPSDIRAVTGHNATTGGGSFQNANYVDTFDLVVSCESASAVKGLHVGLFAISPVTSNGFLDVAAPGAAIALGRSKNGNNSLVIPASGTYDLVNDGALSATGLGLNAWSTSLSAAIVKDTTAGATVQPGDASASLGILLEYK